MPAIDLASGTGSTNLITTSATEHFWCDEITVIPDTAGVFELLSGSTSLTGEVNALAGAPYSFFGLRSVAVGDNLVLSRVDAMAVGGTYQSRVK
jgi:hypothetical protein